MSIFNNKKKKEELARVKENERREKEYQQRILINRAMQSLKKAEADYKTKKDMFLAKAVEAKKQGLKQQYATAANALKAAISSEKRVGAMIMHSEIVNGMRDMAVVTNNFVQSVKVISEQLKSVTESIDYTSTINKVNDAVQSMTKSEMQMQDLSTGIDVAFNDFVSTTTEVDADLDKEIEALISNQAANSVKSTTQSNGKEINSALNDIDRMLKDE